MTSAQRSPSKIHIDPNWTTMDWEQALAWANRLSPKAGKTVLAILGQLFPPTLTNTLRVEHHPVVGKQWANVGRAYLLEVGAAVAVLRPDVHDIGRLRNPNEFEGAAAELCAGLMFKRAGAKLERPPSEYGRRRCEYIATFPDGYRLAVEVKLPDISDDEPDANRVEFELLMVLMERFAWLSNLAPSARATFHLAPDVIHLGNRHEVNMDELTLWVDDAVNRVRAAASASSVFGEFDLGRIGSLLVHDEPGLNSLCFDAIAFRDAKRRSRQIKRNLLNDGARQIGETGLPGVIVLDVQRDGMVRSTLGFLSSWALNKKSLAAVIVVERHVINGQLWGCVEVLPGPEFDAAMPALSTLFDGCDAGHLHYNPLSEAASPCPCTWLPQLS
jgi:hypothetical protein